MITEQTHLPEEAYRLAAHYELGEPIRLYQATPIRLRTLGLMIAGIYCLLVIVVLIASGFQMTKADYFLYPILFGATLLGCLPVFIHRQQTKNAAVFIYSNGFIARDKKHIRTARWEEITEVIPNTDYTSCVVQLTNGTSIKPNPSIYQFRFMVTELELKAQSGAHPEMALEIERLFEHIRNDPPWLRQAQKKANLYQEMAPYLKRKDPEEAFRLGEDYQLGVVLNAYRPTLQSLFLPNANTWGEWFVALCILMSGIGLVTGRSFSWITLLYLIAFLLGLLNQAGQLRAIWRIRLYCYEKGLIYIQQGSFSVVKWEQIIKTVYSKSTVTPGSLYTLHLSENENIGIDKRLDKQKSIQQILQERTPFTEVSSYKQQQNKA